LGNPNFLFPQILIYRFVVFTAASLLDMIEVSFIIIVGSFMNTIENISISNLSPNIGAEVSGVDLSQNLNGDVFEIIHQAFLDHLVLLFRDQNIPPLAQISFTEHFGAAEPHPLKARKGHPEFENILRLENRPDLRGARNDFWHSDISCAPKPPAATLLHALTVPEDKGDTMFCNMYRAWEGLSPDLKEQLSDLTAVHSGEAIRRRNATADTDGNKEMTVPPSETHPVVRKHPETSRQALYTNRFFTTHFTGMSVNQSMPFLEEIERQATQGDNIYRHRWRRGDTLLWDNRCTMHFAFYDYDESTPRLMHRTTAAGDRPHA
jgi:taurine dioxygenase